VTADFSPRRWWPAAGCRCDAAPRCFSPRTASGAFRVGKIDILGGHARLIAKRAAFSQRDAGGHRPYADLGLQSAGFPGGRNGPFKLLTQVAGARGAGRGDVEGEVFVAEFLTPFRPLHPNLPGIMIFEGFWDQEIGFRKQWSYPPFTAHGAHRRPLHASGRGRRNFPIETLARRLPGRGCRPARC